MSKPKSRPMPKTDLNFIHDMLIKLDDRLDTVDQQLHSLDKTAALQQVSLEEHMRRTALLEQALEPVRRSHDTVINLSTTVFKIVGGAAVVVGIWAAIRG